MSETPNKPIEQGAPLEGVPASALEKGSQVPMQGAQPAEPSKEQRPSVASSQGPALRAVAGGKAKARPSIAGAKRVGHLPSIEPQPEAQPSGEAAEDASVQTPVGSAESAPVQGAVEGAPSDPNVPSTGESAKDIRGRVSLKKRTLRARIIGAVALVLILAMLLVVSMFSYSRWVFPNDVEDFQGSWVMDGADTPVEITDSKIEFSGQAEYGYQLDTFAKTVSVSFTNLQGQSHYRFSADRKSLAIIEGGGMSWTDTLMQDLQWMIDDYVLTQQGEPSPLLGRDQGVLLHLAE